MMFRSKLVGFAPHYPTVKNPSLDTHLSSDTFAFFCFGSADCGIQGVQLIVIHKQISCLVYFVIGYQNVEIKILTIELQN